MTNKQKGGLKSWATRRNKKIFWSAKRAIYLYLIILGIILIIKPITTAEAKEEVREYLPVAEDKIELTVQDIILIEAHKANFEWTDYLMRLANCESRFNQYAINGNGGHSNDRGVFQINDYYHPEVSSECAFDTACATRWTMEQINAGRQSMWVCDQKI